ncbi:hypothetical protein ES754_04690 [Psychrobacter frigidicola]|uniref:Sel1 repeat family protein n=1 Tax=Psychrobacter frigidicola TaxID=45611 RepID=A0A5C7A3N4_9GAMM|nr:hypothetical protein [Psychrobacter frigidicola]TXD98237.1 hypothetical protein ES754_04690 [Psychrobacter frigidicola]
MNAINQPSHSKKPHKFATVTALAAACTMMLSATAIAATDTPTSTVTSTAPSAIDSSKRIVRRAASATATSDTANTAEQVDQTTAPNYIEPSVDSPVSAAQAVKPKPLPLVTAYKPTNAELIQTGVAHVYQPAPITSTGPDISRGQLANIPIPQARISDVSFVPTIIIAQKTAANSEKLDVSLLDDFIKDTSPNARHYPPNFPNRTQRYTAREKIKVLTDWIDPYARAPDASYDVLLRAAKLNGMGRNLDLGSEYTVRGGKYVDRAIKINPNSAEANFLYGLMLSEGGGFKEGQKYLDRAVALGYTEAEQSLAQSDLLSDRRSQALDRLRRLEKKMPDNSVIRQQIKLIEAGKFYIWDLSASDTNTQP